VTQALKVKQLFLLGNHAIAQGAFEGGVRIGAGYPGTPSSEILPYLARFEGVDCRWCPNEKVALEVAGGTAIGGARALATMKHVGLNVAADPLLTLSYTGITAGLVIAVADDPGMHSSQNEQDSRNYAYFAKVPCLEPANSEEARLFTKEGFALSELFDTPVMVRSTTRVSHARSLVHPGERESVDVRSYSKNAEKYVMVPSFARKRRVVVEDRMEKIKDWVEDTPLNQLEIHDQSIGFITGGVVYEYLKLLFPHASYVKLGVSWPVPLQKIEYFLRSVERVIVVEELDPIWEREIRAAGMQVTGRELIPGVGELTPDILKRSLQPSCEENLTEVRDSHTVPRPPIMCAGCPHRGVFHVLAELKVPVTGDIGCYTLGAMPPLSAMDTCVCMGASISMAEGMKLAHPESGVVGVIGDSTFVHGGIPPLIDAVYNQTSIVVIILDNGTTAMTGGQDHPATGRTLSGKPVPPLDLLLLCKSLGVKFVKEVGAYNVSLLRKTIKEALQCAGPAVIVARQPCQLMKTSLYNGTYRVDTTLCKMCKRCLSLGCPALKVDGKSVEIDSQWCRACGVCSSLCVPHAIKDETDAQS